jgi:hypothetical protein
MKRPGARFGRCSEDDSPFYETTWIFREADRTEGKLNRAKIEGLKSHDSSNKMLHMDSCQTYRRKTKATFSMTLCWKPMLLFQMNDERDQLSLVVDAAGDRLRSASEELQDEQELPATESCKDDLGKSGHSSYSPTSSLLSTAMVFGGFCRNDSTALIVSGWYQFLHEASH